MDAVAVVSRLGGTASFSQVVEHSTRASLRSAVAGGRLRRVARGRYTVPTLPAALSAAAAVRGVLSHASAALAHELTVPTPPTRVHVTVPPGSRPVVPAGVEVHWSRLAHADVSGPVTSVLRTVLDCAVTMPFGDALAVADSAIGLGYLTPTAIITAAYGQAPRRRGRCVKVADAADGRSANAFESLVRALLVEHGIRGFVPQVPVLLPGFTAHVDLADARRRVALEADSFSFHADRASFGRDCERYNELVAHGWLVLRVTWEQAMFRPAWVADVVRRTCRLRTPRVRRYLATPASPAGMLPGIDETVARPHR